MKNRLLCIAMAGLFAIGMISCGNPAEPEEIFVTAENTDNYIKSIGDYEGLKVTVAPMEELTDSLVEYYADYYYETAASSIPELIDENGNVLPLTDETVQMLNSDVYSDVNGFMVFVRQTVSDYLSFDYKNNIVQSVIEKVIGTSEFNELPEGLLLTEKNYICNQFDEVAAGYGVGTEEYLNLCGTDITTLASEYARQELVFMKIALEKGFETSDKEKMSNEVFDYILSVTNVTTE